MLWNKPSGNSDQKSFIISHESVGLGCADSCVYSQLVGHLGTHWSRTALLGWPALLHVDLDFFSLQRQVEAGTAFQDPGSELPVTAFAFCWSSKLKASLDLGVRSRFHVLIGAAAKSRCQSHDTGRGGETEIFSQTTTLRLLLTLKSESSWINVRERSWSSIVSAKARYAFPGIGINLPGS